MTLIATLKFGYFIYVWMFAIFSIPLSLLLSYYNNHYLTYSIIFYYTYRFFVPCKYSPYFKNLLELKDYFKSENIILENGVEIPKEKTKKLICLSPHGIVPMGFSILLTSKMFDSTMTKWLVSELMTNLPFINDILLTRNILPCSKNVMKKLMKNGDNIGLIPGGFEEATHYERGINKIFLKDRKGFIKYSLQFNYSIIPVYVFGEEYTYWMYFFDFSKKISLFLNKYKIPGVVFSGKYFTFLPDPNVNINIVVGKELKFPHIENPTNEEINYYHLLYMRALNDLYDRNKNKYGNGENLNIL